MNNNWYKLSPEFFDAPSIKFMRRLPGGDAMLVIYLKIILMSLQNQGQILFEGACDNFADELAIKLDEDLEHVQATLTYLTAQDLAVVDIFGNLILQDVQQHSQLDKLVLPTNTASKSLRTPKNGTSGDNEVIVKIIDYLNKAADTNYRNNSSATQKCIKARLNEGYTYDDFVTVIDKKIREWKDTEMSVYIRPQTLFGTKFEAYLHQPVKENSLANFKQRIYTREELLSTSTYWEDLANADL